MVAGVTRSWFLAAAGRTVLALPDSAVFEELPATPPP
jgi:hypothetical protein